MKLVEGRLYLVFRPQPDGMVQIDITRDMPVTDDATAVIRSRGTITGPKVTLSVPQGAVVGPAGQDAKPEQIASAVSAWLTAHPPAAGRPPTTAEVAAAVSAYFASKTIPERVEFSVTLSDAYVLGLLPGPDQKRIACAGIKTTDSLSIQPTAILPAGYLIGAPACTENGWIRVSFQRPTLAVGANNSIPLKITAIR